MSQLAIRVDGLGKHYRLGRRERYLTLRDELAAVARAPWRAFQRAAPRASMWALRDVSFELERGDTLGVIGANGAGKSTLLKILSRITEPTSGRAEIHGRIGSLLEVGTGFHPELTGRENVFLSGAMLGMSRVDIARRFDEIVEFAGVAPFVDTPVKQYSSGMAVRLGFAVAAHLDVDILVVDEALAVGDVAFQRKCLGRMAGAARDGRTVLFVSHDLAAIASLTRRAICLDRGTVIASGATADVARHYLALAAAEEYDGFSPLTDRPRPEEVIAPGAVRLDWVRTTDRFGEQCAAFPEREPIAVEFGFTVLRDVANLEFITGVASVEPQVVVFLATSPAHRARVAAGAYTQSMKLDPNFLGAGAYSLGLKVLVNGARVDTLHDALRFRMQDPVSAGDPPGEYRKRGALMQFDYRWGAVQPLDTGSADWPARAAGRPEMRDRELVGHLT